jgi:hypothetical protein
MLINDIVALFGNDPLFAITSSKNTEWLWQFVAKVHL